jgi:hypothetical protein
MDIIHDIHDNRYNYIYIYNYIIQLLYIHISSELISSTNFAGFPQQVAVFPAPGAPSNKMTLLPEMVQRCRGFHQPTNVFFFLNKNWFNGDLIGFNGDFMGIIAVLIEILLDFSDLALIFLW